MYEKLPAIANQTILTLLVMPIISARIVGPFLAILNSVKACSNDSIGNGNLPESKRVNIGSVESYRLGLSSYL